MVKQMGKQMVKQMGKQMDGEREKGLEEIGKKGSWENMKILVSACLLGENCKYSGGNNYSEAVARFIEKHAEGAAVTAVCPEVLGGLPTPRVPSELVCGEVMAKDGRSVDKEFREGARRALEIALSEKVELAILQSRSPSCGLKEVYDGSFTGKKVKGMGVFARLLTENGVEAIDVEDLEL